MFKHAKGFIAGILFCIVCSMLFTTVFAAPADRMLRAIFNNIRITINGDELVPTDAAGRVVEPFIVDGTTYLPVRAMSEAFGMTVAWDSATQTVILTGQPRLVARTTRSFEYSFASRQVDPRWTREGRFTVLDAGGLRFDEADSALTLTGFEIPNDVNFAVEFTWDGDFAISLGVNEAGEPINILSQSGASYYLNGEQIGFPWIGRNIRIEVENQEAFIYVADQLRGAFALEDAYVRQIRFSNRSRFNLITLTNFSITIEE